MKRNNRLNISILILLILGIGLIYLGFNSGPKMLFPPILTGVGFMVIAWVFSLLKEK